MILLLEHWFLIRSYKTVFIQSDHGLPTRDPQGKFIRHQSSGFFVCLLLTTIAVHVTNHTSPNLTISTLATINRKPIKWHRHDKFNIVPGFLRYYYSTIKQRETILMYTEWVQCSVLLARGLIFVMSRDWLWKLHRGRRLCFQLLFFRDPGGVFILADQFGMCSWQKSISSHLPQTAV